MTFRRNHTLFQRYEKKENEKITAIQFSQYSKMGMGLANIIVDSWHLCVSLQKLEEQDRKALNVKEQLQREHRYLKRRLEQLSVSGSVERIRTDSMGSTISTDSEQGTLA